MVKNINKSITKTTFINKRNDISSDHFLNINNTFISYILKNDKTPRIYGVDGSFINLFKNFNKYRFMFSSKNETYF